MSQNIQNNISGILLFLLLFLAYLLYSLGLTGSFILDDISNLSSLGEYKDLSFWDNFWLFLLEGNSGPTGRPISLASFYLNDISWPSNPADFSKTNILIHLLNGVLVYWVSYKLSEILNINKAHQASFALLVSALWVLHPIHTTTVLYIIQRMTELSATFMLTGILFYLYGREQLSRINKKGFITLFVGVGISLLLSILSKENGILLVAFILVIEFFLLRPLKHQAPKHFNYWLLPVVILPFISLIIYLGLHTDPNSFKHRDFTLSERLLTEPRILFDYLQYILLPKMGNMSLFNDDYIISKGLFNPISTLFSVIGIIFLLTAMVILRKKTPIISFAIAWFFAGHIIESTVIPLELYFEHRNYLPLFGILFAITWYAYKFIKQHKKEVIVIIGSFIALNIFILIQNTSLWGNPLMLAVSGFQDHPNSARARQIYLVFSKQYGINPKLMDDKKTASKQDSMFYASAVLFDLASACAENKTSVTMLNSTVSKLRESVVHGSSAKSFMQFMFHWQTGRCPNISTNDIEKFLLELASLSSTQKSRGFSQYIHYSLSGIYKNKGDFHNTMKSLEKAYTYKPYFEVLELRASYLASAGLYKEALQVLNDTSALEKDFREELVIKIKQKKLSKLKEMVILAMKSQANPL